MCKSKVEIEERISDSTSHSLASSLSVIKYRLLFNGGGAEVALVGNERGKSKPLLLKEKKNKDDRGWCVCVCVKRIIKVAA